MRRLLLSILFFASAAVLCGQAHVSEIKTLRNERWWGLQAGNASEQPFSAPFTLRTDVCGRDYFTVPMMVSSSGRYVWSAGPMEVSFDGDTFTIVSGREKVEAVRAGSSLREAYLVCYHNNIGNGSGVPAEGLFAKPVYDLSAGYAVAPDAAELSRCIDEILEAGFPAGTILLPRGWESLAGNGDISRDLYPDPAGMINRLHDKGFSLMLTFTPYLPAYGAGYSVSGPAGRLLTDSAGEPVLFSDAGGYSTCLDLSSGQVAAMLADRALRLKDKYGVDGFLFDCRDAIPFMSDNKEKLASFVANWNGICAGFDMAILSSAFYKPPMAAGIGVKGRLSWQNLPAAVNDVVISGLSGYIYPYYPLGYIDGDTDEELVMRAVQLSLFLPMAVIPPAAWKMKTPKYREEVRKAVAMRAEMSDYMAGLVRGSGSTAEPVARHMAYQFSNLGFHNCHDQFMLGSKYLVAPIMDNSGRRTVRLPKGAWRAPDGKKIRGPRVIDADVGDGGMLVYTLDK